jgi:hypothetical protein
MEPRNRDGWDHWLDGALKKYGEGEPRAGLESRISTNLAAEERKLAGRWRGAWVLVGCSVAFAAACATIWVTTGNNAPPKVVSVPVSKPEFVGSVRNSGTQRPETAETLSSAAERPRTRRRHPTFSKVSAGPMLTQFPSQRPLSEQEQLLAEYVRQFPDQARLTAREQEKTEKETEQLFAENILRNKSSGER